MVSLTLVLVLVALALGLANWLISRVPKPSRAVVKFILPSAASSASDPASLAFRETVNQKILNLFTRVEALEKAVQRMQSEDFSVRDSTWLETVPVRNRGRGKKE